MGWKVYCKSRKAWSSSGEFHSGIKCIQRCLINACNWVMAISLSFFNRSDCDHSMRINSAFIDSILANTSNCSIVAYSRTLPSLSGFASRHCFAVCPNSATFNISASLAYTKLICEAFKKDFELFQRGNKIVVTSVGKNPYNENVKY